MQRFRSRPIAVALAAPAILALVFATAAVFLTHTRPLALGLDSLRPAATPSPERSGLKDPCTPPDQSTGSQLWLVQAGSQAGYRARELLSQIGSREAVARTDHVHGYAVMERGVEFQRGVDVAKVDSSCISVEANRLTSVDVLPAPLPEAARRDAHIPEMLDAVNHPYVFFGRETSNCPLAPSVDVWARSGCWVACR